MVSVPPRVSFLCMFQWVLVLSRAVRELREWCQHSGHEWWWYGMFLFNIKFYYNKVYFHKNTFSLKNPKIW